MKYYFNLKNLDIHSEQGVYSIPYEVIIFKFMNEVYKMGSGLGGNITKLLMFFFRWPPWSFMINFSQLGDTLFWNNIEYMMICNLWMSWNEILIQVRPNQFDVKFKLQMKIYIIVQYFIYYNLTQQKKIYLLFFLINTWAISFLGKLWMVLDFFLQLLIW